ncbi:PLC-like phosphodiesterase [Russula dissimulans]|nr:PLC-like phosphodiesterase [Russula dissimulans]
MSAATAVRRASVCNGHAELCSQSYANVTYVGAHDSYAVGLSNNLFVNQDYDVTQQLSDGIRMLQMQAHKPTNGNQSEIHLCHTNCSFLDGGRLQDYLTKVKTFMDKNPNEVVSILIVNSDGFTPTQYDDVYKAVGLDALSYKPTSAAITTWPSLSSMIDSNQRLVSFLDTGADFNSVSYLIDEFSNVWETAFDVTDTTFNCTVNRGNGNVPLYLINHFLDKIVLGQPAPDPDQANITNAVSGTGALGVQVQTCAAEYGRNPNFMLVDFYEYGGGSVFQVAATANGVTYSPSTPVPSPRDTSTASVAVTTIPNGAVLRFGFRDLIIPGMLSLGLLGGSLAVLY